MTPAASTRRAPLIIAAPREQTSTIIFLHGLGGTAADWTHLAHKIHAHDGLQSTKFIFPDAEERLVTLWEKEGKLMPAWFDIPTWNDMASDNNDQHGMESSREMVLSIVAAEIKEHGIPTSRIFVGGFSQGGCVALFTGVTSTVSLAGVFGLSTYLPMVDRVRAIVAKKAPACSSRQLTCFYLGHGNGDPKVKLHWAQRTVDAMTGMGFSTQFEVYRGMFHQVWDVEIDDLCCFLNKRLGT